MSLTVGIVGMPNVGKSTLFNAITNSTVEAANYPFATISPNTGTVEVADHRLDELCKIFEPLKRVAATIEFTDIAGLVKGASKGEGLGNQFLANIRETDAICHVVRCFENSDILHVDGSVDALRDAETINLELIFADLDSVEKRIQKVEKKAQTTKEKDAVYEYNILKPIKEALEKGLPARSISFDKDQLLYIKNFHLLTMKPVIYVANLAEEEVSNPMTNPNFVKLSELAKQENAQIVPISARIEEEVSVLDKEEKTAFLQEFGIEESGLDKLVKAAYDILGLKTFFTSGKDECRAWTFKAGMSAPQCAGIIHTDFEKGFIRAEVMSYEDLIECGSEIKVKEAGKARLEGKEYLMQDGDICHFRFNV